MGQEATCKARFGRESSEGKALLESDHVLFRGAFRVKALFKQLQSVEARGGELLLATPEGVLTLELGAAAVKWASRILNPASRLDKLGVKAGSQIALIGKLDEDFAEELNARGTTVVTVKSRVAHDLVFLVCPDRKTLARVAASMAMLKPSGALWIVYPKGVKDVTEMDVLSAGRAAGLTDTKVASFSATHTALRFVIPVAKRARA